MPKGSTNKETKDPKKKDPKTKDPKTKDPKKKDPKKKDMGNIQINQKGGMRGEEIALKHFQKITNYDTKKMDYYNKHFDIELTKQETGKKYYVSVKTDVSNDGNYPPQKNKEGFIKFCEDDKATGLLCQVNLKDGEVMKVTHIKSGRNWKE